MIRSCLLIVAMLSVAISGCAIRRTPQEAQEASERAARIFSALCISSLPSMTGLQQRLHDVNEREWGSPPNTNSSIHGLGGSIPDGMAPSWGTPEWSGHPGEYRCAMTVFSVGRQRAEAAFLAELRRSLPPGIRISHADVDSHDEFQAWSVSGAKPGMRFELATGTTGLGEGVIARFAWP